MSYPGGQPPQGMPAPGQYPAPQPQFAPPVPPPGGQPPQPGGPQQQWGAPPQGGFGQSPAQPQFPGGPPAQPMGQPQFQSGPYPQPVGQPPAQFGPGGQPGPYGQHPGQPAPNDPPGLTVDCSYFPLAFLFALTKPKIQVNGQQVPNTRWGPNHIPVGAGMYHVRVTTPWILFDMPAETSVSVQPGQGVRYYYRTPAIIFMNGAIGPVPQKTPGILFVYISWALAALIILLNLVMIASM
ncbi:hypothetical protein [Nocardia carnea]|uniref:hypothetical protein n=1 Tax=Nocardia carnea TaxID=37328 RepID=UPI00245676F7|nr:hypothetical protein [Nocardia carnea]